MREIEAQSGAEVFPPHPPRRLGDLSPNKIGGEVGAAADTNSSRDKPASNTSPPYLGERSRRFAAGEGEQTSAFPARYFFGKAAAILALLFTSSFASAAKYGDIEVTVKNAPRGAARHGYAEIEFLVSNRSPNSHEVRISYPRSSYGYGTDYLRSVSRTVTVESGKSARLVLAYPERLNTGGDGATVAVDGRDQEDPISVGASSASHGYGPSYGASGGQTLALYSKEVDTRFPDWVNQAHGERFGWGGGPTGREVVRAEQAVDQWSTNWLAYTRYDGVVVTGRDMAAMPAEVRDAVGQYVECGGSLLVLGYVNNPPLPGPWKLKRDPDRNTLSVATPGFGHCIVTELTDLSAWPAAVLDPVIDSWTSTAQPWQRVRQAGDANSAFPVVDDVGVPVKGLLVLMFVFVVVIGPVNLFVLAGKRRKLWLFWTVPTISFFTCFAVICFMAATEGWQGRSRVEGFTVLDENSRRASSLAWTGFYTPLLPRGGLHFSPETEVTFQNGDDSPSYSYPSRRRGSSGSGLAIDWTRDQHLSSGWLTPRVPAHFVLRKSELRRERMTITKRPDGATEAVNGLGADLGEFWYRDGAGKFFYAQSIPAGERMTLEPRPAPAPGPGAKTLRDIYRVEWSTIHSVLKSEGPGMLAPRTYFGVMESAPFLDDGMPGASVRRARSAVYGICKEGGDGG